MNAIAIYASRSCFSRALRAVREGSVLEVFGNFQSLSLGKLEVQGLN